MIDWSKIIAASVVPVVLISACGLLCLAFYNRLAAIVSRLRSFQREQLHEQELLSQARAHSDSTATVARHERIVVVLTLQTQHVTLRAHLIRRTLMSLLGAIACFIGTAFALGIGQYWRDFEIVALAVFGCGLLSMLAGIGFAMRELTISLEPVQAEARAFAELNEETQGDSV